MAYSTAKKQREALSVYKAANRASIRAWNREWRKRREAEDPEFKAKARAAERRWYAQNREKVKLKNKLGRKRYAASIRNSNLKALYGITQVEYDRMLKEQGGCCAICGGPPVGKKRVLSVDHNHVTKKVRQLLCDLCNTGLGRFKDDVELLRRAVAYLERHDSSGAVRLVG